MILAHYQKAMEFIQSFFCLIMTHRSRRRCPFTTAVFNMNPNWGRALFSREMSLLYDLSFAAPGGRACGEGLLILCWAQLYSTRLDRRVQALGFLPRLQYLINLSHFVEKSLPWTSAHQRSKISHVRQYYYGWVAHYILTPLLCFHFGF